MTNPKKYNVVYKKFEKPGLDYFVVEASNKNEAKVKFIESRIKYDFIHFIHRAN